MSPQERRELLAMVQSFMATTSSSPGSNAIAPPLSKDGEPEPWDLDTQSKAYNVTQDWADLNSDPAVLGGFSPGTVTRDMVEPSVTYSPLKGWNMVEATYRNQPNSLEGLVAQSILAGEGSFAAYNNIVRVLSSGQGPEYERLSALVPPRPPGQWATNDPLEKFDLEAVKKLTDSFQSSINSEPVPTRDPSTITEDNPLGDYIRNENGQIATSVSEDTPVGQWFKETGTPLPWEQYTTNDIATPQQQRRRDQSFADTAEANSQWNDFRALSPTKARLSGTEREAYITNMMRANMTTPDYPGFTNQTNNNLSGQSPERSPAPPQVVHNPGKFGAVTPEDTALFNKKFGIETRPDYPFTNSSTNNAFPGQPPAPDPGQGDWATPGGGVRQPPRQGSRAEADLRLRDQERMANLPGAQQTAAWKKVQGQRAQNHKQLADEALRRRMVEMMTSQGVTPYNRVMGERRSDQQRAGFGY